MQGEDFNGMIGEFPHGIVKFDFYTLFMSGLDEFVQLVIRLER